MNARFFVSAAAGPLVLAAALIAAVVSPSAEAQWFKCPNGQYNLQVNQQLGKARCVIPARQIRKMPDAGCPIGTTHAVDSSGRVDRCMPVTGTVGGKPFSAQCANGQRKDVRRGRDRCFVLQAARYAPVSVRE
ncbi:MAG: hypothetical protein AAF648_14190 [Pseudomonadota bacterium]